MGGKKEGRGGRREGRRKGQEEGRGGEREEGGGKNEKEQVREKGHVTMKGVTDGTRRTNLLTTSHNITHTKLYKK